VSSAKQQPGGRSSKSSSGHIRIPVKLHRNVSLIKVTDTHLAEELLARRRLAGLLAGRLSEHVLLVRPGQEAAVIEELRKIGQSPQVIRGGGA
jgi:hypothetical protein